MSVNPAERGYRYSHYIEELAVRDEHNLRDRFNQIGGFLFNGIHNILSGTEAQGSELISFLYPYLMITGLDWVH